VNDCADPTATLALAGETVTGRHGCRAHRSPHACHVREPPEHRARGVQQPPERHQLELIARVGRVAPTACRCASPQWRSLPPVSCRCSGSRWLRNPRQRPNRIADVIARRRARPIVSLGETLASPVVSVTALTMRSDTVPGLAEAVVRSPRSTAPRTPCSGCPATPNATSWN